MKENFDGKMEEVLRKWEEKENRKPRIFLHSCCGPCSTAVIERLYERSELTVFYYNPNIDDRREYEKRLVTQKEYLRRRYGRIWEEGLEKAGFKERRIGFMKGAYDPGAFYEAIKGLEEQPEGGSRCQLCFALRLRETAKRAKEENADFFATTLSVSPMKDAWLLNRIGLELQEEMGIAYLPADFKKRGGYQRSIFLSRAFGLYRQHYCGCSFGRIRQERETKRRELEKNEKLWEQEASLGKK